MSPLVVILLGFAFSTHSTGTHNTLATKSFDEQESVLSNYINNQLLTAIKNLRRKVVSTMRAVRKMCMSHCIACG
jgi:hypothetical protein